MVKLGAETFEVGQTQIWSDLGLGLEVANDLVATLSLCPEP